MRAYQVTSHEAPAQVTDLPVPTPGPGEIRLATKACGLNFADLLMQKGTYQETPPCLSCRGWKSPGSLTPSVRTPMGKPLERGLRSLVVRAAWPSTASSRQNAP